MMRKLFLCCATLSPWLVFSACSQATGDFDAEEKQLFDKEDIIRRIPDPRVRFLFESGIARLEGKSLQDFAIKSGLDNLEDPFSWLFLREIRFLLDSTGGSFVSQKNLQARFDDPVLNTKYGKCILKDIQNTTPPKAEIDFGYKNFVNFYISDTGKIQCDKDMEVAIRKKEKEVRNPFFRVETVLCKETNGQAKFLVPSITLKDKQLDFDCRENNLCKFDAVLWSRNREINQQLETQMKDVFENMLNALIADMWFFHPQLIKLPEKIFGIPLPSFSNPVLSQLTECQSQ